MGSRTQHRWLVASLSVTLGFCTNELAYATNVAVSKSAASKNAVDDLEGSFRCEGSDGDNGNKYRGQVTVQKTGATYQVLWEVGRSKFMGTAVRSGSSLAVTYLTAKKDAVGVALYNFNGGRWIGVWSQLGGTKVGTEVWLR